MLHTQSNPVLHGNLVALDLELCLPSHVLKRREAGKMAGKASRRAFGLASVLCRARDYYLALEFLFARWGRCLLLFQKQLNFRVRA
jgi:hypothetical protein